MRILTTIVLIVFLFAGCSRKTTTKKQELLVFCAASLTDVITDITSAFEE